MPEPFSTFDLEIGARARGVAGSSQAVARLCRQARTASDRVDLHALRQVIPRALAQAEATVQALRALHAALPADPAELLAGAAAPAEEAYATALERACASERVSLEGAYPDYRVFPFHVHVRLAEARVIIGKRSWWALRPAAVARAVRSDRDRILGGAFAAARFGAALATAYDLLARRDDASASPVALRDVLAVLQLGAFGRNRYTRDEFVFDLYRYRQTPMRVGGRRVILGDLRHAGAGFEVPNGRGGLDRLVSIQLAPVEGEDDGH